MIADVLSILPKNIIYQNGMFTISRIKKPGNISKHIITH